MRRFLKPLGIVGICLALSAGAARAATNETYPPMSGCGDPPELDRLGRIAGGYASIDRFDELGLKALVLRFEKPEESGVERPVGTVRLPRHTEHWLYYQAGTAAMADGFERETARLTKAEGRPPLHARVCQIEAPGDVPLYGELVEMIRTNDGERAVSRERFVQVSRVVLPVESAALRFGQMEWTLEGPVDGMATPSVPSVTRAPGQGFYPWLGATTARSVKPGLPVAAVLNAECDPGRSFAVLAIGDPISMPPKARDEVARKGRYTGRLTMRVRELLAFTAHHGASGKPSDPAAVQASVDGRDYWCPTKREFCFKYVKDGAFRTAISRGQRLPAEAAGLYSLEDGMVSLFAAVTQDRCAATLSLPAKADRAPAGRTDIRAAADPKKKGR